MNKEQLVAKIADKSGLKKPEAVKALDAFQEAIVETIAAGEKVQLIGFGTFDVRERAARTARNPQTGEPIDVPASTQAVFKAGSKLRAAAASLTKAEEPKKEEPKKEEPKKSTKKSTKKTAKK